MLSFLFYLKDGDEMEDSHRIAKLENDMSDVKSRLAVAESSIKEIKEDVGDIKDNTTWILRLLVGGLIGAFITFVLSGGLQV